MDAALSRRVSDYLRAGGSLIASFGSGFDASLQEVRLPELGVTSRNGSLSVAARAALGRRFETNDYAEYLWPRPALAAGLRDTAYVMYMKGTQVAALAGAEILADGVASFFDRDYRHFCSHLHTPPSGAKGHPAVVRAGRCIYFSHPLFHQYHQNAPLWCKRLFLNAVSLLMPDPLVTHDGPSTLQVAIGHQEAKARWVVHLLHYIPERRGADFDVIEDVIPLHDVRVSLRPPRAARAVRLVPEGVPLAHTNRGGRVELTVPRIEGYQMVEVSF